jgi:transposase
MEDSGHIPVWDGQRVEGANARGRQRYCAGFKQWIVDQALKPGVSTAGLAMRNQINANRLRRWVLLRTRRAHLAPALRLMPVTVAHERAPVATMSGSQPGIEIELGGALVRVREGVDACTLRVVLDVLRGVVR